MGKAHQAPAHTFFEGVCTFHEKRAATLVALTDVVGVRTSLTSFALCPPLLCSGGCALLQAGCPAHPCILKMVYSKEVNRSISQGGEGESERTLEAKSLKRRLDPLTIFHKDRTVSEASPAPF